MFELPHVQIGAVSQNQTPKTAQKQVKTGLKSTTSLGITTKTAASGAKPSARAINPIAKSGKVEKINPDTGEILSFEPTQADKSYASATLTRSARYELHSNIRQILGKHRASGCLWAVQSKIATVQILHTPEHGRSRFNNLQVCSMVWVCPFCAAKISERRRLELAGGFEVAKAKGYSIALLTCTVPHVVQDDLKTLMSGLAKAWRTFTSDRAAKLIRVDLGLIGTIRNTEVTHGDNGWHPHFHCIVIYDGADVDLAAIEARWAAQWQHSCVKAGLRRPSDQHGLTLQDGAQAAQYLSKWGMEHEMTKSAHKLARRGGRTPFDIARDFGSGPVADRPANGALFREFEAAFKGARQLFWSKGLKNLLSVDEVTDEELATQEDELKTELRGELSQDEWKLVRKGHRAKVLELSELKHGGADAVRVYVDALMYEK